MILADAILAAAFTLDKFRRRRQESPVQFLLLTQRIKKRRPRARLGFVFSRETGTVDHSRVIRQQQRTGAADHQQALHARLFYRSDNRRGRDGGEMRCADHCVVTGHRRLQRRRIQHVEALADDTGAITDL